ncbi:MAG: hypothetical protein A6F71_04420 [Cycloclasticus sp. symbiont of Poecilosclerida sp. M]|nr:MAG: hypothetical protein A6F71_04420 [Cycloclasticus sp. symbiont of Poecilosclerida sp. M]
MAFRVGLVDQLTEYVIGIAPLTHIRVVHADLAASCIVTGVDNIALAVFGLNQVAKGVIAS